MKHYLFKLKASSTIDDAMIELEELLTNIYELDDAESGAVQIGGYCDKEEFPEEFTHVVLEQSSPVEEVDWQQQWSSYAPDFHHGLAHLDLSEYGGPVLLLKPGAGFGDFSHPTTQLVLQIMAPMVKNRTVFDIGCGSGILTIAAVLLGAKQAFGIDIEQEAIDHSIENAELNHTEDRVQFAQEIDSSLVQDEPCLIVMNMIESEQQVAWQSCLLLHPQHATLITSGILSSQKEPYLQWAKSQRWNLISEAEKGGWSGFVFHL